MNAQQITKINSLFSLADRAKNVGEYPIANVIFAFLANLAIRGIGGISWRIEAEDPAEFPGYYDLFVLYNEDRRWYINVPVPLVCDTALPEFFDDSESKRFVYRDEHCRSVGTADAEHVESMWTELRALLTKTQIAQAQACINPETVPEVMESGDTSKAKSDRGTFGLLYMETAMKHFGMSKG